MSQEQVFACNALQVIIQEVEPRLAHLVLQVFILQVVHRGVVLVRLVNIRRSDLKLAFYVILVQ